MRPMSRRERGGRGPLVRSTTVGCNPARGGPGVEEDGRSEVTTADGPAGLPTALSRVRAVVAGVGEDDLGRPTPCTDWTVADLVDHVISGNRMFASILRGEQTRAVSGDRRAGLGPVDADRVAAYDRAADELLTAFRTDGALERVITVPFGTVPGSVALHLRLTELLVHGWDLARATDQRFEVPDELAHQELDFSRRAIERLPPGRSPFGTPRPVPEGATDLDRLVALLGRVP